MNDCAAIASKADTFNYRIVKQFALMTVVWGIVGMAVGVFLAAPLIWPQLNFDTAW
ncbi:cytochrome C oxidase Cbb3, partial [Burkholderia sp. SIMBA_043]